MTLKIVTHEFKPIVYKNNLGAYEGFEYELWQNIATNLNLDFELEEIKDFNELLESVSSGKYSMGFAGITRTSSRKEKLKMSFFTLDTGLAIASKPTGRLSVKQILKSAFSRQTATVAGVLLVFAFVSAAIYWLIEKGKSVSYAYASGLFESFWWSLVTFSTVGYGDIYPETAVGKLFGIFAILSGLAIFGLYIGQLSAALTLENINSSIENPEDLRGKTVAVKKGTTSSVVASRYGAKIQELKTLEEAVELLSENKVDAVLADAPALYALQNGFSFKISARPFARQAYAFIFPQNASQDLIDKINAELIKLRESGVYDELYKKYFN